MLSELSYDTDIGLKGPSWHEVLQFLSIAVVSSNDDVSNKVTKRITD